MSRSVSPKEFVLDEETHSSSSDTASLIDRRSARHEVGGDEPTRYPPGVLSGEEKPIPHRQDHLVVRIPTRQEVLDARTRPKQRPRRLGTVIPGLLALLGFAFLSTWVLSLGTRFGDQHRIQVILMISDGMGPASETMARSFVQYLASTNSSSSDFTRSLLNDSSWTGLENGYRGRSSMGGMLPLDEILVGSSRTRSSNSLITDSAAGATAFSCGVKTYNGAIGVTPSLQPCGTILEAAKRQGYLTGLVATSRITHATPASFYAHVPDRDLESEIAEFLVGEEGSALKGLRVDFAFGGGKCFFLPNGTRGSCRTDGKDMLAKAKARGVRVVDGMAALRAYKDEESVNGPILGLFASDHMDYEVDRQRITALADEQPSLEEMATHALRYLSRKAADKKGFFLMIEGSRIDMAAHNNDPIGHLSDMLAYQQTVQYVKDWVDTQNKQGMPTMLISVSDHETGGLALGRQLGEAYPEYLWYPDALINATHSSSHLGSLFASRYPAATRDWVISELFGRGLGIGDAAEWEVDAVWKMRQDAYGANRALADAISRRAQLGWSTAGHSGIDVNVYAYGYNSTGLTGNVENTDIGLHIAENMRLNLDVVTIELGKGQSSWFDAKAGNETTRARTTGLGHYHGDF
ncbi:vacuolar alkaline phosphatase [Rhodotorula toruloides]